MLKNFVKLFSGDPTKKTVEQYGDLVEQVNGLEEEYEVGEGGRIYLGQNLWSSKP